MHAGSTADELYIASEKCQQEKRKTVNGEDILFAMTSLGFENYAEALKIYLSKYREVSLHAQQSDTHADSVQTQSARGENQNRPTSSGYGGNPAAAQARFPEGPEGANSILNPSMDPSEQEAAYGYPPMVGQPHNGAGGDTY